MPRRAAPVCAGRFLPFALIACILVAGVAGLAACGGDAGGDASIEPTATVVTASPPASPATSPSASPSPTATPAELHPVTLYFLRDGDLCAVERRLEDASADAALTALFAGPTAAERSAGVSSAVPRHVRLISYSSGDGEAVVDVSAAFARSADEASVRARLAQVVYTTTGRGLASGGVARVTLQVRGVPIDGLPSADGDVEFSPTRAGYRALEPAIFIERPGLGAVLTSPFKLTGTASVYEGSFQVRLVDTSGRRIVNVTVQATRGAPGRGRFSKTVAYSTSATAGTLLAFDVSMEDGSRRDAVRIPVTFVRE